ncbi:class I SAM-dependent methyltransferase [Dyella japonica]|uniref:SAM-binding motif n=1 Tax=Dyella japonica A8 TaxID=1217721 RepID=A0A075K093_9GAMM|nr:class I SAM-dependent methyltransferase [Dyella japonica]AIF47255.1 SAM-binding motif [Dyella japonica A8]
MKRQPKLVLRESCINDVTRTWTPGSFVEMGAGTGHMSKMFLDRGFDGASHDLGEDSRQMIRDNLAYAGDRISVPESLSELATEFFDNLLAFEVLEHIESDAEVLGEWMSYLKPGGRVLISVPAHARKYGRSDEIVGHVRRYERDELHRLLAGAGVERIQIINYGFPITELTRPLSNWLIRGDRSYENMSAEQRSIRSAQARPKAINRVLGMFSDKCVLPFVVMQRWFYRFDLGDGYVAWGVKRGG